MKAISIRQPWAWLILNGKDTENRDWYTSYRGPIAIHAAKGMTLAEYDDAVAFVRTFDPALAKRIPMPDALVRGAVIGRSELVACTRYSSSKWFQGKYGLVLVNTVPCEPVYVKGALGLWEWKDGQ